MSKQTREELEAHYRAEEKRQLRTTLFKRIGLWTAVIGGLFLLVYGLARLGSTPVNVATGVLADPVNPSTDWIKGSTLAKTTFVEYADFECPACGSIYPLLKKLQQKYGAQVQFVFRHYPLPQHRNADLASRTTEAAGKQGKFWEMHDKLFENQASWTDDSNTRATFTRYAQELSLNVDQFLADLDSAEVKKKIQDDITGGNRSGVQATPTFFLNGKQLANQSYEDLDRAIESALQQK